MLSYAGNTHPIVVLRDQAAFDEFTFDPSAMRTLMDAQGGWAGTVTILHPPRRQHLRSSKSVSGGKHRRGSRDRVRSGVDRRLPAQTRTRGHSAADHHPPGRHVGRPSVLAVEIPVDGGIAVTGTAVPTDDPPR